MPEGLQQSDHVTYIRFGYIDSSDGDTLSHASQASEGSYIILDKQSSVYVKHVFARVPFIANYNAIIIAFDEEQHKKLVKSKFFTKHDYNFRAEVKFELKHFYFTGLHESVDHLSREVVRRLIPTDSVLYSGKKADPYEVDHAVGDTYAKMKLDDVQMEALHRILNSSSALPVLVAGPFGTGKTRLLARAAYEILRDPSRRVLICAHHQASADTFVEYFGEMRQNKMYPFGMIRMIAFESYRSDTRGKYNDFFKTRHDLTQEHFESSRLVITTFSTASRLYKKMPQEMRKEFFTDILLDEGAQSREPETVGPLGLAGRSTKIVIAGDHCQVCLYIERGGGGGGRKMSIQHWLHWLHNSIGYVTPLVT